MGISAIMLNGVVYIQGRQNSAFAKFCLCSTFVGLAEDKSTPFAISIVHASSCVLNFGKCQS